MASTAPNNTNNRNRRPSPWLKSMDSIPLSKTKQRLNCIAEQLSDMAVRLEKIANEGRQYQEARVWPPWPETLADEQKAKISCEIERLVTASRRLFILTGRGLDQCNVGDFDGDEEGDKEGRVKRCWWCDGLYRDGPLPWEKGDKKGEKESMDLTPNPGRLLQVGDIELHVAMNP